jgi:hypothetical protein
VLFKLQRQAKDSAAFIIAAIWTCGVRKRAVRVPPGVSTSNSRRPPSRSSVRPFPERAVVVSKLRLVCNDALYLIITRLVIHLAFTHSATCAPPGGRAPMRPSLPALRLGVLRQFWPDSRSTDKH